VMNHKTKTFSVASEEMEKTTSPEQMVNILMSSARTSTVLSNENMEFKVAKAGFWGWQYDREEDVSGYKTKVYDISGIDLVTKVGGFFCFISFSMSIFVWCSRFVFLLMFDVCVCAGVGRSAPSTLESSSLRRRRVTTMIWRATFPKTRQARQSQTLTIRRWQRAWRRCSGTRTPSQPQPHLVCFPDALHFH